MCYVISWDLRQPRAGGAGGAGCGEGRRLARNMLMHCNAAPAPDHPARYGNMLASTTYINIQLK